MTAAPLRRVTVAQLREMPATVSVETAAAALGIGRSTAYDAVGRGDFPAKTITVGRRLRVTTASLIALLNG
jgi:hypothetical protein